MTAIALSERFANSLPDCDRVEMPVDLAEAFRDVERKESPTSITTFSRCPLKWYLERYSPLEGGETGAFGVIGSFVHRVLEVFYCEKPDQRNDDLLWDLFDRAVEDITGRISIGLIEPDLKEGFDEVMRNSRNKTSSEAWFFSKAEEAVKNLKDFDGDYSLINVIETECWVRITRNGVLVRGKIDRVIGTVNGEQVDDWKTGKPPREKGAPDFLDPQFIPMGLYALMRSEPDEHGALANNVSAVRLIYLTGLEEFRAKVTEERLNEVSDFLNATTDLMNDLVLTGDIIISPAEYSNEGQCSYCPASGICPAYSDGDFGPMREKLGF